MKQGDRVGAVCSSKDGEMIIFGYGVYSGDEIPPKGIIGPFGIDLNLHQMSNPKITLDSGEIIWGCECWWGAEESVKVQTSRAKSITIISPNEYRKPVSTV